jgi:hypothetical protein
VTGLGPTRRRGYAVLDDDKGNFWTEFRRYGGVDVLGYPVSQPYHYPQDGLQGLWYQAFQRGILQFHPETGRAELANVFEQFTEADPCNSPDAKCLDNRLLYFGIPLPKVPDQAGEPPYTTEQRMGWLTEPRLLARYFFDPVAYHSSEPDRPGETAFATQEQAWAFFGLPQGEAERLTLREPERPSAELWPLYHSFIAQRFQKGGLELFTEDASETFDPKPTLAQPNYPFVMLDPTVVPGDGRKGCVALTAVGLLARTIGIDRLIPTVAIEPIPPDPSPSAYFETYVPPSLGQPTIQFQLTGTEFAPDQPVTIQLTDHAGKTSTIVGDRTYADGSFDQVLTAPVDAYTVTVSNFDRAANRYSYTRQVDLSTPTSPDLQPSSDGGCRSVGLPSGG